MTTKSNFHTHTLYADGKNTPMEMAQAALECGMEALGFSEHSPAWREDVFGTQKSTIAKYVADVAAVRQAFSGRLRIYCGLEQDSFSPPPDHDFDYLIGSVHYLCRGGCFIPVDDTPGALTEAADRLYGGDTLALAEDYYDQEAQVIARTGADIIGHFDLITKFSEKSDWLDTNHPRYRAAWKRAADVLLETGRLFEINTGAISRGWRTGPYPAEEILVYLRDRGARFVLSSDVHQADAVACHFAQCEQLAARLGLPLVDFEEEVLKKGKKR